MNLANLLDNTQRKDDARARLPSAQGVIEAADKKLKELGPSYFYFDQPDVNLLQPDQKLLDKLDSPAQPTMTFEQFVLQNPDELHNLVKLYDMEQKSHVTQAEAAEIGED